MARYRSHYDGPSFFPLSIDGAVQRLACEPGGEVDVPDVFDRLVPKLCPQWRKVEPKAPEPVKAEAPKAEPQKAQPAQHQKHGGK